MKTNHPYKLLSLLATALVAVSVGIPTAIAQQPPTPAEETSTEVTGSTVKLEDFVVTAQKVARPLKEVPMSVLPISAETVAEFKLFEAKDLVVVAPALNVDTTSPNNPIPSMRGITYDTFSGVAPTVNIYWNELSVDAITAFRAMYDVGQVEVLRGPQGTLRAGSAPAGALLFTTRKPDLQTLSFSTQLSASNQDLLNTQFALNLPLQKGKLALRVAGLYNADDANHAHNIITGNDSRSHTRSARASLEWKPTKDIDVRLVHQYLYQSKSVDYIVGGTDKWSRADLPDLIASTERLSVQPTDNLNIARSRLTSLNIDVNLPGQNQLNFIGGYQNNVTNTVSSTNIANLIPGYAGQQLVTTLKPTPTTSYELRFGSVNHKFWDYVFGAYYTKGSRDGLSTLDGSVLSTLYFFGRPAPVAPDGTIVPVGSTIAGGENYIKALFTTQTFKITDKLKVEAGLRMQHQVANGLTTLPLKLNAFGSQSSAGTQLIPTALDVKPTTGSLSLSYKVSPDINTYLSYGRSYRPPGDGFNTVGPQAASLYHFNAETSDGFELGIKTSLLNRTLQLNADVYYQKFDGYQQYITAALRKSVTDNTLDAVRQFTQNGNAVVTGIEVGMTLSLPQRFLFNLDAGYSNAVWAGGQLMPASVIDPATGLYVFNTPGSLVSYANVGGQRLGNAPKLTISSRLEWSKPVSKVEVFARTLARYKSNRQLQTAKMDIVGGYTIVDLQAGIRSKSRNWDLTVWGKNVLNKQTVDSFRDPIQVSTWVSGYRETVTTDPVEYGVTLAYHY